LEKHSDLCEDSVSVFIGK